MSDDSVGRELFRKDRYGDLQRLRERAARETGQRDVKVLDRLIESRRPVTVERELRRSRGERVRDLD